MKEKTFYSEKEMMRFLKGMPTCKYIIKIGRKKGSRIFIVDYVG